MAQHNIAVIGAGAVGLSSALSIQRSVPRAKVTIIADKFDEGTTSWGAAGVYRLDMSSFTEEHHDLVRQWGRDSWKFYTELAHSENASETGHAMAYGTAMYQEPRDWAYSLIEELAHDFRKLNKEQIRKMKMPERYTCGYSFTTVSTYVPTYLRWLMIKFREAGGSVICRKVESISELSGDYDLVVNCCGIRALELCEDKSVYPVMGHLIKVNAPWFKNFLFSPDVYLYPHADCLIIGKAKDKGNWSLAADPNNRQVTLSKAYELFPSLKAAPIVGEWVGLRPGRPFVRLELEMLQCGRSKTLPVVHNYGHEGHGITLSWGCAVHATKVVQEYIAGSKARL